MNKLMGKVAGELGLDKELHYALVPILNQYFDLFEPFLNRNDKWKWYECLEDYKRYKAQVLAEI